MCRVHYSKICHGVSGQKNWIDVSLSIAFNEKRSGTRFVLLIICFNFMLETFPIEPLPVEVYLMLIMVGSHLLTTGLICPFTTSLAIRICKHISRLWPSRPYSCSRRRSFLSFRTGSFTQFRSNGSGQCLPP